MNKKIILTIIGIIIIIVMAIIMTKTMTKRNKNTNDENNISLNMDINVLMKDIDKLNILVDEYYMNTFDKDDIYISYYSYLSTKSLKKRTIKDLEQGGYDVPKSLANATIHFVKPKSLKPYLKDGISDTELEVLTVYTAVDTKDGVYISSKFDKGGLISKANYQKFLSEHNWELGENKTPKKGENEYKAIIGAVLEKNTTLKDGNVKYIKHNDKYAIAVISKKDEPSYIKEYALKKENGKWDIIIDNLEKVKQAKYINYNYTDFNLNLLPIYEVSDYKNISSDGTKALEVFIENGYATKDDSIAYYCGAGKFSYIELSSGKKILCYAKSDGLNDIYEVDNIKMASSKMTEIDKNAPIFILNF